LSDLEYDDYKKGYGAGKESAGNTTWSHAAQSHVDVLMGRHDDKSEWWWKGFRDGKEGNWDPP
jgi:hypothetical protein